MELLSYFFVAGLGRRAVAPAAEFRTHLRKALEKIADAAPGAQPIALASGAAGADQAFLEVAHNDLHWPIRILLPEPARHFEQDFKTDSPALKAFRELRNFAIATEVIAPTAGRFAPLAALDKPTEAEEKLYSGRRDAFTRCADQLICDADVVVVLWDGTEGGQGGSNESLLLASHLDIPVLVLDAANGCPWNGAEFPQSGQLARCFKRRYHNERGQPGGVLHEVVVSIEEGLRHADPPATMKEFLARPKVEQRLLLGGLLANRAENHAKWHRRLNLIMLALNGLASTVGLSALVFGVLFSEGAAGLAAWVEFAFIAVAVGLWISLKRERTRHRWVLRIKIRTMTRIARCC